MVLYYAGLGASVNNKQVFVLNGKSNEQSYPIFPIEEKLKEYFSEYKEQLFVWGTFACSGYDFKQQITNQDDSFNHCYVTLSHSIAKIRDDNNLVRSITHLFRVN